MPIFPEHKSLTKIYLKRQICTAWERVAGSSVMESLRFEWKGRINVYRTFRSLRLPTFMLLAWTEDQLTLGRSRGVSGEGLSKTVGELLRVCFSKGFTCKG